MDDAVVLSALIRVPVARIEPGPNARGAVGDVTELAASMSAIGQQQPVTVSLVGERRYRLLDGHRRHAAAQHAGVSHLDAILRVAPGDAERVIRQLAMHAHTRPFDPIAEARALHALMWEHGLDRARIARFVGKSPSWVRDRIALLQLASTEQRAVSARELPLSTAATLVARRRAERDGVPAPSAAPAVVRPRVGGERHCRSCTCEVTR